MRWLMLSYALLSLWLLPGLAYEVETHGAITQETYVKSILAETSLVTDLGLETSNDPFGNTYYDISGDAITERKSQPFEDEIIQKRLSEQPLSIKGWLMRGAIREDDVCKTGLFTPYCDGPPIEARLFNHFFDPVNNAPLNVGGFPLFGAEKATDWVTGMVDAYADPTVPEPGRDNHFSLLDALESMYRALAGRRSSGPVVDEEKIGPNNEPGTEAIRKSYWATTFRTLGDALHIVQDLAQPQHTRNDTHAFDGNLNKKAYEAYINTRALGEDIKCFNGAKVPSAGLSYGGYPEVRFDRYKYFFSTDPVTGDVMNGTGIADYSNRSFFSAGSNVENTDYNQPPTANFPQGYAVDPVIKADPCLPESIKYTPKVVYRGDVADTLHPGQSEQQVALTAKGEWTGIFNDTEFYEQQAYGLARINYDEMAKLLIPRAVSYGAGLIDYFFRGRFEIVSKQDDGSQMTVEIRNVSRVGDAPDGLPLNAGTDSRFELFYDKADGTRERIPLVSAVVAADPAATTINAAGQAVLNAGKTLPPDGTIVIAFDFPTDLDATRGYDFTFVYKGLVGDEEGIAAIVFTRASLLAFYEECNNEDCEIKEGFSVTESRNSGRTWPQLSDGPPDLIDHTIGSATYIGDKEILAYGREFSGTVGGSNYWFRRHYRSVDDGVTWSVSPDATPSDGIAGNWYWLPVTYTGEGQLATLRVSTGDPYYEDEFDHNKADTFRLHTSTYPGTWYEGGLINNINLPQQVLYMGKDGVTNKRIYGITGRINTQNGQIGTERGFWRSEDNGFTFTLVNNFNNSGSSNPVARLAYLGNDTLVMSYFETDDYKFYKSTDRGDNWTLLSTVPDKTRPFYDSYTKTVLSLHYLGDTITVDPQNSKPILYISVLYKTPSNTNAIIEYFISDDGGENWWPSPGPAVTSNKIYPSDQYPSDVIRADFLMLKGDNGAIPGLYD